jgi:hypothetical protein
LPSFSRSAHETETVYLGDHDKVAPTNAL